MYKLILPNQSEHIQPHVLYCVVILQNGVSIYTNPILEYYLEIKIIKKKKTRVYSTVTMKTMLLVLAFNQR
jgi:hypothetical protein